MAEEEFWKMGDTVLHVGKCIPKKAERGKGHEAGKIRYLSLFPTPCDQPLFPFRPHSKRHTRSLCLVAGQLDCDKMHESLFSEANFLFTDVVRT